MSDFLKGTWRQVFICLRPPPPHPRFLFGVINQGLARRPMRGRGLSGWLYAERRSNIFFRTIHSFIHPPRVYSCFLIALRSVEGLPGVPSRDSNSGLPYSKPTHYYLSCAAPYGAGCLQNTEAAGSCSVRKLHI
jgi:hypothetical protein